MILDSSAVVAIFFQEPGYVIIPFSHAHYSTAVGAWIKYGKGRHPASLNFGDCISYATAMMAGSRLLCLGDDFSRTDVQTAP